jgi:hypothetical protein
MIGVHLSTSDLSSVRSDSGVAFATGPGSAPGPRGAPGARDSALRSAARRSACPVPVAACLWTHRARSRPRPQEGRPEERRKPAKRGPGQPAPCCLNVAAAIWLRSCSLGARRAFDVKRNGGAVVPSFKEGRNDATDSMAPGRTAHRSCAPLPTRRDLDAVRSCGEAPWKQHVDIRRTGPEVDHRGRSASSVDCRNGLWRFSSSLRSGSSFCVLLCRTSYGITSIARSARSPTIGAR